MENYELIIMAEKMVLEELKNIKIVNVKCLGHKVIDGLFYEVLRVSYINAKSYNTIYCYIDERNKLNNFLTWQHNYQGFRSTIKPYL